ncbi:Na(+)/H(+) antiporter subunit C [Pseudogracilibacillus auburnensis]|uniref:Multisubunit sodium/proton antiporter MrpC subunit n=1 Tax=Pseudogracilibacillus auburnensis TaxID=1494959 RepID=A0A2V3VZP0_9BACI|nr:Na(+)/H(+) antiporter subunit C [Pseudogracilibacillus auburnensis]PXW87527.1 multisubunit sodium/proton antiporter MrpC subunit [Pseudogracilibacillus auburnensis]
METVIIIVAGVLVTVATYLLLSKNLIRVILGTAILTHAVHLLLMAMGGFKGESVPIISDKHTTYVDALPQALILTSIVISFAVTAFFLVLAYQVYKRTNTDDLSKLRGYRHE